MSRGQLTYRKLRCLIDCIDPDLSRKYVNKESSALSLYVWLISLKTLYRFQHTGDRQILPLSHRVCRERISGLLCFPSVRNLTIRFNCNIAQKQREMLVIVINFTLLRCARTQFVHTPDHSADLCPRWCVCSGACGLLGMPFIRTWSIVVGYRALHGMSYAPYSRGALLSCGLCRQ